MSAGQEARNPRRSTAKVGTPRQTAKKRSRSIATQQVAAPKPGSVIMQARIGAAFARELIDQDAAVLGLDGPSALVREGLRLVHERAREAAMVAAYEEFYDGRPAPLPVGVTPDTNR